MLETSVRHWHWHTDVLQVVQEGLSWGMCELFWGSSARPASSTSVSVRAALAC